MRVLSCTFNNFSNLLSKFIKVSWPIMGIFKILQLFQVLIKTVEKYSLDTYIFME